MTVCRQIRLVLWKNFTIRRRRWPRVIFEILWPLCLFLILMWVRTRNLTAYYNACHNDPKYLGSTGFLPAFQTYVCRWNSTCHNYSLEQMQFTSSANDSILPDFWSQLSILTTNQDIFADVTELITRLNKFNRYATLWNGTIQMNRTTNNFNETLPNSILNSIFSNSVNLVHLHQPWFINRTNSLSTIAVAMEIYFNSLRANSTYFYRTENEIQRAFCINEEINRTFSIDSSQWSNTKTFLCQNLSATNLKNFLIEVQNQFDQFFLINVAPNLENLTIEALEVYQTFQKIRQRLQTLNITLPFIDFTPNISLTTLCGGRHDLGMFQKSSQTSSRVSARILPTERTTDPLPADINWDILAFNLSNYNETAMCSQTYVLGTGSAKQSVSVNRSCRCVLFDQVFNSNDYLKDIAKVLRPLLYGKIYFHPSNSHYNRIIQRVNETFESLTELLKLLRLVQQNIRPVLNKSLEFCNNLPFDLPFCQQLNVSESSFTLFTLFTEFLACSERKRFVAVDSEADLVREGQNKSAIDGFLAGIKFVDEISDADPFPKHLKYKIRMALDFVDSTFRTEDRYFSYQPRVGVPQSTKYHSFSFIYLQNAIERAFISIQTGVNVSYGIQTQQMPYPCWINDKFVNSIRQMLPLFMVLSWIFTVSMNVKDIVYEKEKRLKEIMRIMGLNDSVHWFTWFVLCTTVMLMTALILVIVLKFGKITQFSNFLILILFFVCYTFATINQCFLISVFFNRANLAACGAGIIYFLLYLPYTVLINYDSETETWHKVIACLSSTVAFSLGCDYVARFEGMAKGVQWSNINKGAKPNDNFTFLYCMIMMLADSVIYMILTLYIENVFPGEYGIPQPWYYPVTKSYWFGFNAKKIRQRTEEAAKNSNENTANAEDDGQIVQGEVGVEIQNLTKYYRNKMALKSLSVKFYRNMITAFLGRNGAGKSTTWSILTGLIPPSSGTAFIDGYDILTDIKVVRKKLGFAPQHNILFDRLTVKEHLEFFSALKGTSKKTIKTESEKMLTDLGLQRKSANYSTELSGGMKRKLSIAIAFVGNSTTVILDEPTAGVDPFARRAIWDLILKYKPGRTIVLSTHHLDEADLLSDRLAIISSGELQCVGTTMFLKRKYGEGYNLIVELTSTADENELRQQRETNVGALDPMNIELNDLSATSTNETNNRNRFEHLTDFLKNFAADIRVKEFHGDQITYVILDDAEHTKTFPRMLAELDANKNQYRIKSYGLSNSSLEQVFLRVADEIKRPEDYERLSCWKRFIHRLRRCCCCCCRRDKEEEEQEEPKADETNEEEPFQTPLNDEWTSRATDRYTGFRYLVIQIFGLLVKRFHRTKRNMKGLIAEIILPILFVLLAMLVIKLTPNETDPPELILHPWYWGRPNFMFQSISDSNNASISRSIEKTFTRSPSLGTRCISSTMLNKQKYPCDASQVGFISVSDTKETVDALNAVNYKQTRRSPDCDCDKKLQTCPAGAGGPLASYDELETKDTMFRLNNYNITDWSIKTEFWEKFLMKRFGGFEFFPEVKRSIDLLNATTINRILNLIALATNSSSSRSTIDAEKIASLLRVNPSQVAVWYNNKGWPSSVAFLNILNNALLRSVAIQTNPSASMNDFGITAISHPLPQSQIQLDSELERRIAVETFTAICVIFALAFIPASFLVFLIDERVTTSKHLQFVSGVKGFTYWWSTFVWDLTNYCVSMALCIVIFLGFGVEAYVSGMNFLCLILVLFLYGFAIIPLMYPINYFFKTPSTGFVLVSCINIFIGLITTIATITLETFDDEPDLKKINTILIKVFLVFPHYCLGRGLFDMSKIHATNALKSRYVENYVAISPFQFDIVGRNLLSLFLQGVVFFLFAILVQYRFFIPDRRCVRKVKNSNSFDQDDDVAAERQRIYSDRENSSRDVLRMVDLVKVYGWRFGKNFTAVNRTCVGVKQGECFGLLGINGSGKSTTFKMLTGEISMTEGNAYVNNYSVAKELNQVHQNIGYCPQFDALDSLLTAREHLYLYARLRGIKRNNISFIVDSLLKRLGLTLWADRPVRQYSGGNKRKLSTAISLIGNPSIIFMDEPTTGMDVRAKRFLWNSILALTRQDHKSVVITSHSMEECETLCSRLVIMVNGEFKCLGSVQHLKAKFGDGYTILVRTNVDTSTPSVIRYVQERIPEATIREEHNKMIHFRVSTNVPLHQMFTVLEKAREDLNDLIEDYTVTQVTLDDVFVSFARAQAEESNEKPTKESCWRKTLFCKLFRREKRNVVELTRF